MPTTPGVEEQVSRRLTVFLLVVMCWAVLVGLGLHLAEVDLGSVTGRLVLALLYMPSPAVAALVAERGLVRARFRLPRGTASWLLFLLAPAAAVLGFVLLHLGAVLLLGDVLAVSGAGTLATTSAEVTESVTRLVGPTAAASAGPPPPVAVLLLASLWGALLAGWTVNGLFALGEEYGWRGLLWEELRPLGVVPANLLTGVLWGLWHAPLVLQGYNYPGRALLGVVAMVLFCTAVSFALSALRELTDSVLPAAAAHGMVNAVAAVLLLLVLDADPVLSGPLGLLGAAMWLVVAVGLWPAVRRRGTVHLETGARTTPTHDR